MLPLSRLGLGTAPLGGLYEPVSDKEAYAVVDRAWELGLRFFDTAPHYGSGLAERRLGAALRERAREQFVISTKIGRLLRPGAPDPVFRGAPACASVFDFSYEGALRSLDESLERLAIERVDIALIHDPDDHWRDAIDGAWPALERLRSEGVIGAVGAGMNQSAMLTRFVRETTMDAVLLAGRYTLLEQGALADLLPACLERGVAVFVGGVMNSGLLADPRPGATFNYAPAPPALIDRARRIGEVCARYDVPLRAAAMQFPMAHPAVASLVAGVRTAAHLDEYPLLLERPIPGDLWAELRANGLIDRDAPVPLA